MIALKQSPERPLFPLLILLNQNFIVGHGHVSLPRPSVGSESSAFHPVGFSKGADALIVAAVISTIFRFEEQAKIPRVRAALSQAVNCCPVKLGRPALRNVAAEKAGGVCIFHRKPATGKMGRH